MELYIKNLGKVSITVEGLWDINKKYEKLSIVHSYTDNSSYISKKDVPSNIELTNSDYWMPIIRYSEDNNIISEINKINENINKIDLNVQSINNNLTNINIDINKINNDILDLKNNCNNNEDLNNIKDYLIEIEKITYPLVLTISGANGIYEKGVDTTITLNIKVSFKGNDLKADDLYIEINNTKIDNLSYSETINITKTYKVTVKYNYILFNETITIIDDAIMTVTFVDPCWFGFNEHDNISDIIINEENGFTKYVKLSPTGAYTITGNTEGYVWLIVPNTMKINKVTMEGFEFPIEELNTGGNSSYKHYRSSNKLKASSYSLLIS